MGDQAPQDFESSAGQDPVSFEIAMRAELDLVLTSPAFTRAPIMKRLLAYLVEETLVGRGDQLKAYSVAVDGLGRAPDYDARADSYPRVQVGRLRRLIAEHYAQNPPGDRPYLTIPNGRYRVMLERGIAVDVVEPDLASPSPGPRAGRRLAIGLIGIMVFGVVLTALLAAGLFWYRTPAPEHVVDERPMLELTAVAPSPATAEMSDQVRAVLLDGLRRSAIFDVRTERRSGPPDSNPAQARYRLATEVDVGASPHVALRLWHLSPDRLLWSVDLPLPAEGADQQAITQRLTPAIALIGRADGLIATQELTNDDGQISDAYHCLLIFHRYRRERMDGDLKILERCVADNLKMQESAMLHAAASYLAVNKMTSTSGEAEQAKLLNLAQTHAQFATTIDPTNPWAVGAQARVAGIQQACPRAVRNAASMVELDPYEPVLLSDAGVVLLNCHDPRAEPLIRRAIATDEGPDGRFYWPLVLLGIDRNDRALAAEALDRMTPPVIGRRPRFYLVAAAGYAMLGDTARARLAWQRLVTAAPDVAANPHLYFQRLGIAPEIGDKALAYLRRIAVIKPDSNTVRRGAAPGDLS